MPMKINKKRRRNDGRPSIHPNNKYSENPPDFALLASLYPSFEPFVFYSSDGCPRIDWTDFNATRELTRVLLLHDHGVNWWIPDGQLCPTVPNRSNYIHWIEDLLLSNIIPKAYATGDNVKGFDIGTGANCIYPLIGASLLGWSFVGSDVTDIALEWAEKNVKGNPHISELIEIRRVENHEDGPSREGSQNFNLTETSSSTSQHADANESYCGPPILLGVVKDGEKFDFCMCNPPFFGTMEEAGLNPKTSCGGTPEEMVCSGGERAFITRIIKDSFTLKHTFCWYTTMVGRKANLKYLTSKLWKGGVTIVKTTEFVQGQTHRWGLAWSFVAPANKITPIPVAKKNNFSFMLEGIQRQFSAIHVLQFVESLLSSSGASCNLNSSLFTINVTASHDHCNGILKNDLRNLEGAPSVEDVHDVSTNTSCLNQHKIDLCFRILVFQQIPGTLLVKGSLKQGDTQVSGVFSLIMQKLEQSLKRNFCRGKAS